VLPGLNGSDELVPDLDRNDGPHRSQERVFVHAVDKARSDSQSQRGFQREGKVERHDRGHRGAVAR
jgi:hypothetical protein